MSTPSLNPLHRIDEILAARAAGVPWTDLGLTDQGPVNPVQLYQARGFVQFRHGRETAADAETVQRAARILRSTEDAPLVEQVLGLTPQAADAADFSDLTQTLDDWATDNWSAVTRIPPLTHRRGRGRHASDA